MQWHCKCFEVNEYSHASTSSIRTSFFCLIQLWMCSSFVLIFIQLTCLANIHDMPREVFYRCRPTTARRTLRTRLQQGGGVGESRDPLSAGHSDCLDCLQDRTFCVACPVAFDSLDTSFHMGFIFSILEVIFIT